MWSRSYGSWINNYLCNQCLSPLVLLVRISIKARSRGVQHYVIKCVSDLRQVGGFFLVPRFPPQIKLTAMIYTNVAEILLNVALNTIKQTNKQTHLKGRSNSKNSYSIYNRLNQTTGRIYKSPYGLIKLL